MIIFKNYNILLAFLQQHEKDLNFKRKIINHKLQVIKFIKWNIKKNYKEAFHLILHQKENK